MAVAWKPSLVFEGSLPPPLTNKGSRRCNKVKTPPLVQVKVIKPLSNGGDHWVSPQFNDNMQCQVKQKKRKPLTARTVLFEHPVPLSRPAVSRSRPVPVNRPSLHFTAPSNDGAFNPSKYSTPNRLTSDSWTSTTNIPCTLTTNVPCTSTTSIPYTSTSVSCTSVTSIPCTSTTSIPCTSTTNVPCTSNDTSSDSILALDTPTHLYGISRYRNTMNSI